MPMCVHYLYCIAAVHAKYGKHTLYSIMVFCTFSKYLLRPMDGDPTMAHQAVHLGTDKYWFIIRFVEEESQQELMQIGPSLTQRTIYTTYTLGRMPKNILNWATQKCNCVYCWTTTEYAYGLQLYIWTTSLLDCMWTMCSLLLIKAVHYNWPVSQNLLQSHLLWPIEQPETQWCDNECYQEADTNTTSKLNQHTKALRNEKL